MRKRRYRPLPDLKPRTALEIEYDKLIELRARRAITEKEYQASKPALERAIAMEARARG